MKPVLPLLALTTVALAADPPSPPPDCPMHATHMAQQADHFAGVDARGDQAMGFSHQTTVHHFTLTRTGGIIAVSVTDPADVQAADAIRGHLAHVATAFAAGDFALPGQIHGKVPPGVDAMKRRKAAIQYRFERTEQGARVVIITSDAKALEAVHAFLRFQIADHRTGDTTSVAP